MIKPNLLGLAEFMRRDLNECSRLYCANWLMAEVPLSPYGLIRRFL